MIVAVVVIFCCGLLGLVSISVKKCFKKAIPFLDMYIAGKGCLNNQSIRASADHSQKNKRVLKRIADFFLW